MLGAAVQADLRDSSSTSSTGQTTGLVLSDGNITLSGIYYLSIGNNLTLSLLGPGRAALAASGIAPPPPTGEVTLYDQINLVSQIAGSDENTDKSRTKFYLGAYTDYQIVVYQQNVNGGTYDPKYDAAGAGTYTSLGTTLTTGGNTSDPYVSAWLPIPSAARVSGGVFLRVDHSGDTGSTDVGTIAINFRGSIQVAGGPARSLQIGTFTATTVTITAAQLTLGNRVIIDPQLGNVTLNIPAASSLPDGTRMLIYLNDTLATGNSVTVTPVSGTIATLAVWPMNTDQQALTIVANTANNLWEKYVG